MLASSTETAAVRAFAEAYRVACAAGPITVEDAAYCPCCGGEMEPYERDEGEAIPTHEEFHPFNDALMIAWPQLNAMAWAARHAGVVLTRRGRNLLDRCEASGYAPLGLTSEEMMGRMYDSILAIGRALGVEIPRGRP